MKTKLQIMYPYRLIGVLRYIMLLTGSFFVLFASTSITMADGVGFNPNGTTPRPGQLSVTGIINMAGFTNPLTQYTYIYLKEGESLFYEIERAGAASSSSLSYSVFSPNGLVGTEQTASGAAGAGPFTDVISVTAQTAGIWILKMQVNGNGSYWRFNVDARTVGTERTSRISGRVYTQLLHLYQTGALSIPLYVGTPSGHKYDVLFNGYYGLGSRISSDQYGNTSIDNCTQALYKSVASSDQTIRSFNEATCGIYNKLFFTAMDPQMPASAAKWDMASGTTITEWLNPPVMGPVVTNLNYTPSGNNALSGNFTFNISDYVGNGSLQLDLDNDGIYGGANDRNLPFSLASSTNISVSYDGLGANGLPLAAGSQIKAKVLVDRTGEVHFTMIDVEQLGGIKITRTTGDVADASRLYWDDTQLNATGKSTVTPELDGSAGVNSNTALGVHGWAGTGSDQWGNNTLIDNWAYVGVAATQEITVESCNANAGTISR